MARTYLYKLTSDRGGAPCALPAQADAPALLSLAICKPAIRRTAEPGDRIVGITSHALAHTDGYPLCAVIYAAIVGEKLNAEQYCEPGGAFLARPDCIYEFHRQNGENSRARHAGRTGLHLGEAHLLKDLGTYPLYRNGQVLLCRDFRYFGPAAVPIPATLPRLRQAAESLGQGHRTYAADAPEQAEFDALFRLLWKKEGRYSPREVAAEAYEPGGRHRRTRSRPVTAPCAPGSGPAGKAPRC